MPISSPIFGGTKRAYFSHKAIADTTLAATTTLVLNPLDGTKFMGPPKPDILPNANSAQGQGEWATSLTRGATHLVGQHKYWLTSQALGMFAAMATPSTSVTQLGGSGGDYQHTAIVNNAANTLMPHTVQESYRGAAVTDQAYKIKATVCNGWTIDVSRGNQFATITADLIGNTTNAAAEDMSTYDVATYMPTDVATPPTKCGLWMAATTTSNHTTAFDGTIATPTTAGVPFEDLDGASVFKISLYALNYSLSFSNNINESDLFEAGMSSTAGFIANTAAAYVVNRTATLTMSLDLNATQYGPVELMEYLHEFADASQQSYTVQMTFVNDTQIASSGTYYGGSIVVPAMRVVSAEPSTNINGPMTLDVTMEGMAAYNYADDAFIYVYNWDHVATDYDAVA